MWIIALKTTIFQHDSLIASHTAQCRHGGAPMAYGRGRGYGLALILHDPAGDLSNGLFSNGDWWTLTPIGAPRSWCGWRDGLNLNRPRRNGPPCTLPRLYNNRSRRGTDQAGRTTGNGKAAFQLARSLLRCRMTRLSYNHISAAGMNVRACCSGRTQGAGTSIHVGAPDITANNSCHYWRQRSYR